MILPTLRRRENWRANGRADRGGATRTSQAELRGGFAGGLWRPLLIRMVAVN